MKNLNREQQIEIQKHIQKFEKRQVYWQLNLDAINSNTMSDKLKDIYESRK